MKIEPPQGVCLTKIYNHLKEFVSWRYNYLKEFVSGSSTQALKLDISRSSSHGSRHKLSSLAYQGVRLMDLDTNFQARHKLMLISLYCPILRFNSLTRY